jgi:Tol biopolymer transport system component
MSLPVPNLKTICFLLLYSLIAPAMVLSAEKLPPEKAGTIGKPQGKIAFIRDGSVWIMEAGGANQDVISEIGNADGRLSWSPDSKTIVFTRSGQVNAQLPDNTGGIHKVYDLFLAYPDSAYANKKLFWYRLTDDMGSRDPEWSADGSKIIFWKDLKANLVNAYEPNYQICIMDPDGANMEVLRKDWQTTVDSFLISPSMNAKGEIAFVGLFAKRPQGLAIVPKDKFTMPLDSVRARLVKNSNCVAPSWSPDGKWLAFINNDLNDGSLYIATGDLKEKYVVFTPPPGVALYTIAPSFSPDSKWLTFSTTDGSIWIVDITGNGSRRLSGPGTDKFPAWSKAP